MHRRGLTVAFLFAGLVQAQTHPADAKTAQPNPAAAAPEAPPFVTCPAGGPIGAVDLRVRDGGSPLPFRTINHLSEGDTLLYAPILRGKEKRPGEIALVLVPLKRQPGEDDIVVSDPKPADQPQEWKMTETISVAALVYGPAGLSRKKVSKFLAQDEVLIAQLADYADKTSQAEQLVTTLSNSESSAASVNAALNGFAAEYGFAVQINRDAPVAAQAQTVFAAMNPQLANYNPLASAAAASAGQTASMATMAATLFFGSPIGLAAGGTAMLLDLRSIAFPDTQFRASFVQPLKGSGVNLCGQQGAAPPHTRVAYIWASRIPNASTPSIHIGDADFIPNAQKTPVPVEVPAEGWKYLERAREWALVNDQHKKTSVPVVKLANQKALEIDLTKAHLAPGDYKLTGFWDWMPLEAAGTIHVVALSDFKTAHLDPASQDRLLAKSGKVPVTLRGTDFEFTTKVELQKLNDEFATAQSLRFLLPKGLREGPQDHMDVQIDTARSGCRRIRTAGLAAGRKKPSGRFQNSSESAADRKLAHHRQPGRGHAAFCPEGRAVGTAHQTGGIRRRSQFEPRGIRSIRTKPHRGVAVASSTRRGAPGKSVSPGPQRAAHLSRRAPDYRASAGNREFQTFAARGHGDRCSRQRVSRRIHAQRDAGRKEHRT